MTEVEVTNIKIINMRDWLDYMGFDEYPTYDNPDLPDFFRWRRVVDAELRGYLDEYPDTMYYAVPRTEFSVPVALERAHREGFTTVIVEVLP